MMIIIIMVITIMIMMTATLMIIVIIMIIILIAAIIKNFSNIHRLDITCYINIYDNTNIVYHYESSVYESI